MQRECQRDSLLRGLDTTALPALLLAMFIGREARRWTVAELRERLRAAGRPLSEESVRLALVDLGLWMQAEPLFPYSLVEAGTEWSLTPDNEAVAVLSSARQLSFPKNLGESALMVLSAIVFQRLGPGVTKNFLKERLGFDVESSLAELVGAGLIYSIPEATFERWKPSPSVLHAFGYSSWEAFPGYKEFSGALDSDNSKRRAIPLVAKLIGREKRRRKREQERRQSLGES